MAQVGMGDFQVSQQLERRSLGVGQFSAASKLALQIELMAARVELRAKDKGQGACWGPFRERADGTRKAMDDALPS